MPFRPTDDVRWFGGANKHRRSPKKPEENEITTIQNRSNALSLGFELDFLVFWHLLPRGWFGSLDFCFKRKLFGAREN